jgi:hypothetical protein
MLMALINPNFFDQYYQRLLAVRFAFPILAIRLRRFKSPDTIEVHSPFKSLVEQR